MDREKRETAFAEQYLKFLDSNLKPKVAFEKIQKMGYTGTRSTMNRHIASLRRTGHALSLVKKDRSHSSLNDHQMSIVNSWISDQNTNNRPIGYSDVQKFIYDTFSIEVCTTTAGNILHRLGHTQKNLNPLVRVKQVDLTSCTVVNRLGMENTINLKMKFHRHYV
jgi:transposase